MLRHAKARKVSLSVPLRNLSGKGVAYSYGKVSLCLRTILKKKNYLTDNPFTATVRIVNEFLK